jgi:hypothetical protein
MRRKFVQANKTATDFEGWSDRQIAFPDSGFSLVLVPREDAMGGLVMYLRPTAAM